LGGENFNGFDGAQSAFVNGASHSRSAREDDDDEMTPPGKKETGLQPAFTITIEDPQKVGTPSVRLSCILNTVMTMVLLFTCSSSPSFRRFSRPVHNLSAQRISLSRYPIILRMVALLSPYPHSCRKKHRAVSAVVLGFSDRQVEAIDQPFSQLWPCSTNVFFDVQQSKGSFRSIPTNHHHSTVRSGNQHDKCE